MISLVGFVVVLYVLVRISTIFNDPKTDKITSVLAILTGLVCLYALFCLFTGNVPFPPGFTERL